MEALRVDYTRLPEQSFCEHCGMILNNSNQSNRQNQMRINEQVDNINLPERNSARAFERFSINSDLPFISNDHQHQGYINHKHIPSTTQMTSDV